MRLLALLAALMALALLSGFAVYEWRSPEEPVRVEPVELLPPPEPRRAPLGKRGKPNEARDMGGTPAPVPSSTGDGSAPVPPAPVPAGDDDDDGGADGGDDDGDDDGGDD
jgi:hypothetical protein